MCKFKIDKKEVEEFNEIKITINNVTLKYFIEDQYDAIYILKCAKVTAWSLAKWRN